MAIYSLELTKTKTNKIKKTWIFRPTLTEDDTILSGFGVKNKN